MADVTDVEQELIAAIVAQAKSAQETTGSSNGKFAGKAARDLAEALTLVHSVRDVPGPRVY